MADVPSMSKGLLSGAPSVVRLADRLATHGPTLAQRSMERVASDVQAGLRSAAAASEHWAPHAEGIEVRTAGNTLHVVVPPEAADLEFGTLTDPPKPLIRPVMADLTQRLDEMHNRFWAMGLERLEQWGAP